jgi:hypothetical protein
MGGEGRCPRPAFGPQSRPSRFALVRSSASEAEPRKRAASPRAGEGKAYAAVTGWRLADIDVRKRRVLASERG